MALPPPRTCRRDSGSNRQVSFVQLETSIGEEHTLDLRNPRREHGRAVGEGVAAKNVDLLRQVDVRIASAFDRVFGDDAGVVPQGLASVERALILFGLFSVHGDEGDIRACGSLALDAGAAPEAVLEVVLTAAMSRGPRALSTSRRFLSELALASPGGGDSTNADPIAYLQREFGTVPDWAKILAEFSPAFLADYTTLRERILCEGASRRRTKELLTMALNAIGGNRSGVVSHADAALQHGAEVAHLLEALLLAVRVGGIIAWITGIETIDHLVSATRQPLSD